MSAGQLKVCGPSIRSQIKETNEFPILPAYGSNVASLYGSNVASFGLVAKDASVGEVIRLRGPAVFFTDDVIGFAAIEGICLGDQAILA
jgi:hypothetical protein